MRLFKMSIAFFVCVTLMACVAQRESLPPPSRAELVRLGRIITDETREREERKECLEQYYKIITTALEVHGRNAVSRRTIVESLGLVDKSGNSSHVYSISNGDGSYYMLFIDYDLHDAAFVRRAVVNADARM